MVEEKLINTPTTLKLSAYMHQNSDQKSEQCIAWFANAKGPAREPRKENISSRQKIKRKTIKKILKNSMEKKYKLDITCESEHCKLNVTAKNARPVN